MSAQHTPGPWRVEDIGVIDGLAIMAPDRPGRSNEYRTVATATCDVETGILLQEAEANAQLIAIAPELLAELRGLLESVYHGDDHEQWLHPSDERIRRLRALVAKAEGREL